MLVVIQMYNVGQKELRPVVIRHVLNTIKLSISAVQLPPEFGDAKTAKLLV
jgi:hypothetical protein